MKVCLVNYEGEGNYLPISTAYIAAYLIKKGYKDVSIIDRQEVIPAIRKIKPDIIGFTVFSNNYFEINQIAGKLKKIYPNVPIIAGGPHIYCMPDQLKTSNFDLGVTGEGEETMYNLLRLFDEKRKFMPKDLRKINGIIFRNEKNILERTKPQKLIENLDDIPFPALHLLNMKGHYTVPGPAGANLIGVRAYLLTSRGCPYRCIYCGSHCIWNKVRWHSAERTVSDIMHWVKKYGANHFYVYDDLIIANLPRLRKIIELLKKEGVLGKIDFEILARANLITDESCKLLKELNTTTVIVGFESGSEKMLQYLKKDSVSVEHNRRAIDLIYKYGMKVYGLFIIGSPHETEEDLLQTYDLASNKKIDTLNINVATPFPGTEFWDYAVKYNIYPRDFFDQGISITPVTPNFNYLLTREISKDKFISHYKQFMNLIEEREKTYHPMFKPSDIKFFFHPGFIRKLLRRRKWIWPSFIHFMNSLGLGK